MRIQILSVGALCVLPLLRGEDVPEYFDALVHIHGTNVIPPGVAPLASRAATKIFTQAGIRVGFRYAAFSKAKHAEAPILVNVHVRKAAAVGIQLSRPAVAHTQIFEPNEKSTVVVYASVKEVAGNSIGRQAVVLAHVLAHEVAHALQAINVHSESGIMKPVWNMLDYMNMFEHPLQFEEQDVARMKKGIQWSAERTTQTATRAAALDVILSPAQE